MAGPRRNGFGRAMVSKLKAQPLIADSSWWGTRLHAKKHVATKIDLDKSL